jgi:hypothetical protein
MIAAFPNSPFQFAPPPGGDPYFDDVVLLLHCDGTNGSTTFTDNSPTPKTITAIGNAQVTTSNKKFGTGAANFDGVDDALSVPGSSDWAFGTGDFTVELFVRFTSVPTIITTLISNYPGWSLQWRNDSGTVGLYFLNFNTALGNSAAWTPAAGTWYYLAVKRSGTALSFWIDAVQSGSNVTNSTNLSNDSSLRIGALNFSGTLIQDFNGQQDEIRITKGVARDVSTVPTGPFSDS